MLFVGLIDQASSWWQGLEGAKQVFYGIGMVAGFAALILAVLSFVGLEQHDTLDALDAAEGAGGLFSVKPLVGFFLGFGWGGGLALNAGLNLLLALLVAGAAGCTVMLGIVFMVRAIHSMRSDGTMRIERALGAVGTVYVTVPPHRASGGQVTVNFSGRQETFAALSAGDSPIPSGDKVKVTAIIDPRTVQVEAL